MIIDRNITIEHEIAKSRLTSNGKPVSDLYLWKHYRALVIENERLQARVELERWLAEADSREAEHESFLQGTRGI